MNEASEPLAKVIVASQAAVQVAPTGPGAPRVEVVQLVRSIGAESSSEVQSVDSVNQELAALYAKGYKLAAVRPVAAVPGGVMVFYMFIKGA